MVRERATSGAEPAPEVREIRIDEECVVVFVAVEKGDAAWPESVARQLADDTAERAVRLAVRRVVVYPYVHLTEEPASPRVARRALDAVVARLQEHSGLEVLRTPFGWYKAFGIEVLGHPLSEWSGRFVPAERSAAGQSRAEEPDRQAAPRARAREARYVVADAQGNAREVDPDLLEACPLLGEQVPDSKGSQALELLGRLVRNELEGGQATDREPRHIELMRRHELVEACEVSEKGHHKWYPKGLLIRRLLLDMAGALAREWGAVEIANPIVLRGDHNEVGELMGEFHERDYQVDGGRGLCYLRYASDPLAFPYLRKVRFSHRQSPLKVYEEASCFRNEQQGEVSGLKRVRAFLMTDMHAACTSVEQAREEMQRLTARFAGLMDEIIAPGRWVLAWDGVESFFEANREWLLGIGRELGMPAFFRLMPEMSHYYAMKNELQAITGDGANVQISTVQWDVKDGARFDIGAIDASGQKVPCPVILHASSFGSIERALCAILETAVAEEAADRPPMLPLWLAPTQVRLAPVSREHLDLARDLADQLEHAPVRVDIDDRDGTIGWKIRQAEQEWVPYIVVLGDREREAATVPVRCRSDRRQRSLSPEALAAMIRDQLCELPYRPLPLPRCLSQRPSFAG